MAASLIVFDVDGTLVDSGDIIHAALTQTLIAFGRPVPPRAEALKIVGLSLVEAFVALTGDAAASIAMADHYKGLFGGLRSSGRYPEPLYPGIARLVESLRAGPALPLGIATGKSVRGVDALLARLGWQGWFATVQTADDAPSKPHPAMLLQAAAATGVAIGDVIMVGDSVHDMRMAVAAGARAIGVAWGFHPPGDLLAAGASAVAADTPALGAMLAALRQG